MSRLPERPLSRDRAWACVTLNFAISGWGSLKAGRIVAGVCQLVCVFAGFGLMFAWMMEWINRIFQAALGGTVPPVPANWLWQWGIAGFVISYSWMLLTCASLMRQAKSAENKNRQDAPPRLEDLPKRNSENQ